MKKFFVLYRLPVATMEEWKKNTKPEEMGPQMEKMGKDMMEWSQKHEKSFVDQGAPLGKTKTVTSEGIKDTANDLNYYCVVEAESHEDAAKIFSDNPHLQIPTSFIEVMDIPHVGM